MRRAKLLLRSILTDSHRRKKDLMLAWLDLRDAFGSVPHEILLLMMSCLGLDDNTVDIVQDIYTGSTIAVRTGKSSYTPYILQARGVIQGCQLESHQCLQVPSMRSLHHNSVPDQTGRQGVDFELRDYVNRHTSTTPTRWNKDLQPSSRSLCDQIIRVGIFNIRREVEHTQLGESHGRNPLPTLPPPPSTDG